MKFFGLLILFIFSVQIARGQELLWSTPDKSSSRATHTEVIGQNTEGLFIARYNPREPQRNVLIERYNPALRRTANRTVLEGKNDYYATTVLRNNELQLFYAYRNREGSTIDVRISRMKFILTPEGSDSTLFSIPEDANLEFLQVYKGPSGNNVLFLYTTQKESIPTEFHYTLVDSNAMQVLNGSFTLDFTEPFQIEQTIYNDHSLVFLLKEDVKKKVNRQGYQYHLIEGNMRSKSFTVSPLFNDTLGITEGILKADTLNKAFIFTGLYNAKDSGYAKGYYIWRKTNTGNQIIVQPFTKELVAELSGKTSKLQGLFNLQMTKLILRADGGIVLIAEEFQKRREMAMDMGMYGSSSSTFRNYYFYENLLVMSIGLSGLPDWHRVVRKEQISVNDEGIYSSCIGIPLADRLVFLYNDLSRRNVNLIRHEVTSTGSANQEVLIRTQDFRGRMMPQYGRQISYNEVIIPGYARRGVILLKVLLD